MIPGDGSPMKINEARQGMEEDILTGGSGKAFSGKMIIVQRPEGY